MTYDPPVRIRPSGDRRWRLSCAAVVVLNGSKGAEARSAWDLAARYESSPLVVAVDGGIRACKAGGIPPQLWVGDGDSAGRIPSGVETVIYDTEKDFSDLGGALRECARRGVDVPVIAGLVGGRLDHEWANVQEVGSKARSIR